MEMMPTTISKNDNVLVHITPNKEIPFSIKNGINYNMDALELKYDEKYCNSMVTITFSDADGRKNSYSKILESGGYMSWMHSDAEENPNFGSITFNSSKEVVLDFRFK